MQQKIKRFRNSSNEWNYFFPDLRWLFWDKNQNSRRWYGRCFSISPCVEKYFRHSQKHPDLGNEQPRTHSDLTDFFFTFAIFASSVFFFPIKYITPVWRLLYTLSHLTPLSHFSEVTMTLRFMDILSMFLLLLQIRQHLSL